MRLDKFLKLTRIIKRRTLAKDVADQGRITINGNKSKAASTVSVGDVLVIHFAQKKITIEVTALNEKAKKDEAEDLYKILKEEKPE